MGNTSRKDVSILGSIFAVPYLWRLPPNLGTVFRSYCQMRVAFKDSEPWGKLGFLEFFLFRTWPRAQDLGLEMVASQYPKT